MLNQLRLIAIAVCLLTGAACSTHAAPARSTPDYQFISGAGAATMPFHRYANLILINVSVNGSKPLPFALDSGSTGSVIDRGTAVALRLEYANHSVNGLDLGWGGFEWSNRTLAVADLDGLAPVLGVRIDGILGGDLFERFVISVDYRKSEVTVSNPASYVNDIDTEPVSLRIIDHLPVVSASIAGESAAIPAMLEIDTGSIDAVTLNGGFAKSSGWANQASKSISLPPFERGDSLREYARVKKLSIDEIAVVGPVAAYSEKNPVQNADGSIGGPILSRFTVVFDYPDKRLYLLPNQSKSAADQPFPTDASGLTLTASGPALRTFNVVSVLPRSPADIAGIERGDVLSAIDGKPTSAMTLDNLRRLLQQSGNRYVVQYVRRGQTATAKIALRAIL